jgi:two-component system, OmpR family, phosphate regulon sensor histidine kinase PhoR
MARPALKIDSRDVNAPLLSSSLIHELRTPLTAIHGYAQVLDRNPANEALVRRAGRVMVRESMRLSWMFTQLSELAELGSPDLPLEVADVDVTSLVASMAQRGAEQAPRLVFEAGDAAPTRAQCDPRRLSQIVWHLLLNAIRFTPDGGRVVVDVQGDGRATEVTISDTGYGVADDEVDAIYRPFTRGRAASQVGERGLGLGLYLAAEVARRCGGRVWHEPGPERGTTFRVRLPSSPTAGTY